MTYEESVTTFYGELDKLRRIKDIACEISFDLYGESRIDLYEWRGSAKAKIAYVKVDADEGEDKDQICWLRGAGMVRDIIKRERRRDGRVYADHY